MQREEKRDQREKRREIRERREERRWRENRGRIEAMKVEGRKDEKDISRPRFLLTIAEAGVLAAK
jgi:hypothetical protein